VIPMNWPKAASPLCALSHGDKGNVHGTARHNYTTYYHELFAPRRERVEAVFELGIFMGNSLRMWRDYFPNATIYGADIDAAACASASGPRIVTRCFDERDVVPGSPLLADWPLFDIMIDDAIHAHADNVKFFYSARHKLKPGGIYVIEDLRYEELDLFRATLDGVRAEGWAAEIIYGYDRMVFGESIPDNSLMVMVRP
jgi:trans-aconitate methyltransferase